MLPHDQPLTRSHADSLILRVFPLASCDCLSHGSAFLCRRCHGLLPPQFVAADFAEACLAFAETTSSCLCRLLANENLCQFVAPSKPSRSSLSLSARWRFGAFRTGSSFQHGVYIAPWTSHCKREMQTMRTRSTRDQVQTKEERVGR